MIAAYVTAGSNKAVGSLEWGSPGDDGERRFFQSRKALMAWLSWTCPPVMVRRSGRPHASTAA